MGSRRLTLFVACFYIPNLREFLSVIVWDYLRVSIAVKKHHDHSNTHKENVQLRLAYSFRGLIYYHHGGKHGSMHADMVLDKEMRVLYLDPQRAGKELA